MTPSRSLVTGVAVWLLVVSLGSTLVWVVITRAGDGVVSSDTPATATDRPAAGPDQDRSSTAGTASDPTGDPSSSPRSNEPATDSVRRTWEGVGGQVTVACRGSAASFVNAIPDSGFVFEIDDRGPDRVRVEFEREVDDERSRIDASCVDGTPDFQSEVDSD